MEIKQIQYLSQEYEQVIQLRNELLRKPIGLDIKDDDLTVEDHYIHIAVIEEGKVIGTCQYKPIDDTTVLMKQVCIAKDMQGKSIGRKMFEYSKHLLKEMGIQTIQVHARYTAIGYYLKMGFIPHGEQFIEVTIPHQYLEYDNR